MFSFLQSFIQFFCPGMYECSGSTDSHSLAFPCHSDFCFNTCLCIYPRAFAFIHPARSSGPGPFVVASGVVLFSLFIFHFVSLSRSRSAVKSSPRLSWDHCAPVAHKPPRQRHATSSLIFCFRFSQPTKASFVLLALGTASRIGLGHVGSSRASIESMCAAAAHDLL